MPHCPPDKIKLKNIQIVSLVLWRNQTQATFQNNLLEYSIIKQKVFGGVSSHEQICKEIKFCSSVGEFQYKTSQWLEITIIKHFGISSVLNGLGRSV